MSPLPTIFVSHGSPMLAIQDSPARRFLQGLGASLPRPKAIVVFSAHWETGGAPAVSLALQPATIHDFGGFPQALFDVQYPAPGNPQLAAEVVELLKAADLPARIDAKRPFDHGVWVPLTLMYPHADIPIVQVSLPTRGGPALQTRVGHALASLREHGVLLIGSGSITHNLRELDWHAGPESVEPWAKSFRDWMIEKLAADDEVALHDYRQQAPNAVRNHPSDEHLLPLYFARGAGGEFSISHQGFTMGALGMDIYRFG